MADCRKPFIETMHELAAKDARIKLIIGDVGFNFLEPFIRKYPSNFLNAGAAEANMMGVANGLSRVGWKPYVYTMRNFIAFRPYEHVRNDLACGNANVKLFGVSGSAAYKFLGYSHNVLKTTAGEDEDIAMLSSLPNMKIYQPQSPEECVKFMLEEYNRKGPAYFII